MQTKPQITFRDIPQTDALVDSINQHIEQLELLFDKIIACHVTIEQSQKKQHQGKIYNAKIILDVPRKQIISNKNHDEDIYVAIRDGFSHTERMLKEYRREQQGEVKAHPVENKGTIARIITDEDYGFIADSTGEEYYFHSTNVHHPDFNHLKEGDNVNFLPVVGDEGMQAHRVTKTD
jgi:ribosomal subunit interface protein